MQWLKPSGRFPWTDQSKYRKALENLRPDIVIQRLSSNVSYEIGQYCKKNECQFIWICTDDFSPRRNFHLNKYVERFNLKNTAWHKYLIFYLNSRIMDLYRDWGMKKVNIAFTQNAIQSKLLEEQFGLKSFRMISGHPKSQNSTLPSERFKKKTILWCANLGVHKRPAIFINLARRMQETPLVLLW